MLSLAEALCTVRFVVTSRQCLATLHAAATSHTASYRSTFSRKLESAAASEGISIVQYCPCLILPATLLHLKSPANAALAERGAIHLCLLSTAIWFLGVF